MTIEEARARAAIALRELSHAFVGHDASPEQIAGLAETLESLATKLGQSPARVRAEHPLVTGTHVAYPQGAFTSVYNDRPISGRGAPWSLDPELHRIGDEIEARLTLRSAHEGPPGRSHGGVIAALFDDIFGYVHGAMGQAAVTGELTVRFLAPTPVHRPLVCRVRLDERVGRKLLMSGELREADTDAVTARSRATFIAVDLDAFRRPETV